MSKLVFKASEVGRVVEHSITNNGQILLVHDQGVYLMSNGQPYDKVNEEQNYVVYAQGCNPKEDAKWYDTAHSLVGGDDFCEELPFKEAIKEQLDLGSEEITLIITKDSVKLGKPKVSAIRKCSVCGRLLKTQEDGELCQVCKDEFSTPSSNEGTDNQEALSTEQPTEEPKQEVKIKPGVVIRECFIKLVSEGKITEEIMNMLTNAEATKNTLKIRYAFLKEFNPELGIKEQSYINGHARYSSKSVEVGGKQYLVTNDLYLRNVDRFMEWAATLSE